MKKRKTGPMCERTVTTCTHETDSKGKKHMYIWKVDFSTFTHFTHVSLLKQHDAKKWPHFLLQDQTIGATRENALSSAHSAIIATTRRNRWGKSWCNVWLSIALLFQTPNNCDHSVLFHSYQGLL